MNRTPNEQAQIERAAWRKLKDALGKREETLQDPIFKQLVREAARSSSDPEEIVRAAIEKIMYDHKLLIKLVADDIEAARVSLAERGLCPDPERPGSFRREKAVAVPREAEERQRP